MVNIGTKIDIELYKLIWDEDRDDSYNKTKYIKSSAIAAYSRISINKFKNIKDNPCIYTDTDSVILPYELDSKYISNEIGKMKL